MQKWFILAGIFLAAPAVPPIPAVREAIADKPWTFGGLAVLFAVVGGAAVQQREWVRGRITATQAASEIVFSALAGFIAYWLAVRHDWDYLDLLLAALLFGVAGRPTLVSIQTIATKGVLDSLRNVLGQQRDVGEAGEASAGVDSRRGTRGADRDGGSQHPP